MKKDYPIVPRQLTSMVASTIIGVGVLTLPRSTTEMARESGWISVILGAIFASIIVYIISKLGLRFPDKTFVEYSAQLLGSKKRKWLGKVLSLPFIAIILTYLSLAMVVASRTFGEVVVTAVLRETPLEIIILTMLGVAVLMALYEVEVLARVNELLLPLILIPILFIGVFSFQTADWLNMFPLFPVSWLDFLQGAVITAFAYNGFEILLMLLGYTKQNDPKKVIRYSLYGVAIPAFIYVMIVLSGIVVFGYEELQKIMWPTLELVKTTEVPGLILERMESAFLGVWVVAVFTTVANLYFVIHLMVRNYFGVKKKWIAPLLLPLFYWLSLLPQNVHELFIWGQNIGYFGGLIWIIIPPAFLIIAMIRKVGKKPNQQRSGESNDTTPSS